MAFESPRLGGRESLCHPLCWGLGEARRRVIWLLPRLVSLLKDVTLVGS